MKYSMNNSSCVSRQKYSFLRSLSIKKKFMAFILISRFLFHYATRLKVMYRSVLNNLWILVTSELIDGECLPVDTLSAKDSFLNTHFGRLRLCIKISLGFKAQANSLEFSPENTTNNEVQECLSYRPAG